MKTQMSDPYKLNKKTIFCDNTNHNGDPSKPELRVYKITLTEDFDRESCNWCYDCLRRDKDMIAKVKNLK